MITTFTAPTKTASKWNKHEYNWDDIVSWLDSPDDHKDTTGYVLGTLKDGKRKKANVLNRTGLTLDADSPQKDFTKRVRAVLGSKTQFIIHTTYSSTPTEPRYRVIAPFTRPVLPEQYRQIARYVMSQIGDEDFDLSSDQPERFMFVPSTSDPETFWYHSNEGEALNPSDILDAPDFDPLDGVDLKPSRTKRDPKSLHGIAGAFNRAFTNWDELIERFDLPYEAEGNRYRFKGTHSAAGASIIGDGDFFWSNHANDPACATTASPFDLVRIHKFGDEDTEADLAKPINRRPSQRAMEEFASTLTEVVQETVDRSAQEEFDTVADDLDDSNWKSRLKLDPKTGGIEWGPRNYALLRKHDPVLQLISYDSLIQAIIFREMPSWRKTVGNPSRIIVENDEVRIREYLWSTYGTKPLKEDVRDLIVTAAAERESNPVIEYLKALPEWDGVERLGGAFPGVPQSQYTDLVARKFFVAAVTRALEPGCKFDHVLVIYGREGTGKTSWTDWMSLGHHAELGDIRYKDTIQNIQRAWFATVDEMGSLSNADWDAQKAFLTQTHDNYRPPYERATLTIPRHFVFVATTNDREVLRNAEGNRRFLVVESVEQVDFTVMTDERRDQIWAEAMHYYREGEDVLYLTREDEEIVAPVRKEYLEETPDRGIIEQYLDDPVPASFPSWTIFDRRSWATGDKDFAPDRLNQRPHDYTCTKQIAVEALGIPESLTDRKATRRASEVMKALPGWKPGGMRTCGPYGKQRVWVREDSEQDLI